MKRWEIWAEGYRATGHGEGAVLLGTATADTFDEAVRAFTFSMPYVRNEDGVWTYWGCRIFDNEQDARKAFG